MSQVVTPGNLGLEFELGTTVPNKITINVDGVGIVRDGVTGELSSPPGSMTYDNGTTTLTYDNGQGGTQNIDLSALAADIFVNGGSFNPTTLELTLTDNDPGTPDVTVDLSSLLGVSTDAGNLLTNGVDGKPYIDQAAVQAATPPSTDVGNLISVGTDGNHFLDEAAISAGLTACTDAFGVDLFKAFPA